MSSVAPLVDAFGRRISYVRLSVIVQWLCEVRELLHLPGRAFVPPPRVASTLVQLRPRPRPLAPAAKPALERVLAAAFGQRRKMLRASLKGLTPENAPGAVLETLRGDVKRFAGNAPLADDVTLVALRWRGAT